MANIKREDLDALNVRLTVEVKKDDYVGDFQAKLKEYRREASLKGFRKGKTPMSVIRKMFGRRLLADIVNENMQKQMSEFLFDEENPLDFLGQPIPAEDQKVYEFSVSNLEDYEFVFDLGLAPEFELKGVADDTTFDYMVVTPDEDTVKEELLNLRRRMGESSEEETVAEEDIVTFNAVELEGDAPKEGGVTKEFTLFVKNATEAAKKELMGKDKGATLTYNVFDLEEDADEKHVRRYLLGLEEGDDREVSNDFSLTIEKISRFTPAEMNEEFFEKAFGEGGVSTEEEALAKIKDDYKQHYTKSTDSLLMRDMQEHLMGLNPMSFPEAFLKRWLLFSNSKNTAESVEAGLEGFLKGLQWTMLRGKLVKHFELEVSADEMKAGFTEQVKGYFGGGNPDWLTEDMINNMLTRMMQDEKGREEMYQNLMNDKIQTALKEGYALTEKEVSPKEFEEIIDKIKKENEAVDYSLVEGAEEEEE